MIPTDVLILGISSSTWVPQGGNPPPAQGGGVVLTRTPVASDYTATLGDYLIAVTSTSAVRTINLPPVATAGVGRAYVVVDESGGAATRNIIVEPAGSETLSGGLRGLINQNYGALRVYCTGANWMVW